MINFDCRLEDNLSLWYSGLIHPRKATERDTREVSDDAG